MERMNIWMFQGTNVDIGVIKRQFIAYFGSNCPKVLVVEAITSSHQDEICAKKNRIDAPYIQRQNLLTWNSWNFLGIIMGHKAKPKLESGGLRRYLSNF
jgi:hypothetical protein